jgi:hypothetical protein
VRVLATTFGIAALVSTAGCSSLPPGTGTCPSASELEQVETLPHTEVFNGDFSLVEEWDPVPITDQQSHDRFEEFLGVDLPEVDYDESGACGLQCSEARQHILAVAVTNEVPGSVCSRRKDECEREPIPERRFGRESAALIGISPTSLDEASQHRGDP